MNKAEHTKRARMRKVGTLFFLVLFVFFILLVSGIVSGAISFAMLRSGIMPPLEATRFPVVFVFVIIFSLGIGTLMAMIGGTRELKPLRQLIAATREVAAGNFDVKVNINHGLRDFKILGDNFNEMTRELASIETLRNDFVGNISHEFKTPVVSIRGFAKLLKKGNLTEEQRDEYLDIIISESDRLTNLSSNVLLLSKLESSDQLVRKGAFSLDEQLRRTILLFETQLSAKQIELELNLNTADIVADEELLKHVWINLLSNAIKFSPEGGTISVEVGEACGQVEVSVADCGAGMDEDVRKHLFDKFYQGDPSRATEGNGLGLSLAQKIVELSDGEIAVESAPGKGTRFTITLPLGEEEVQKKVS